VTTVTNQQTADQKTAPPTITVTTTPERKSAVPFLFLCLIAAIIFAGRCAR
jgi:hypothetical protein